MYIRKNIKPYYSESVNCILQQLYSLVLIIVAQFGGVLDYSVSPASILDKTIELAFCWCRMNYNKRIWSHKVSNGHAPDYLSNLITFRKLSHYILHYLHLIRVCISKFRTQLFKTKFSVFWSQIMEHSTY